MLLIVFLSSGWLPAEDFDWRNIDGLNFLTPVRYQDYTGMCWAFSSVAGLESMYKLTRNDPAYNPDLSEQQLPSAGIGDAVIGGVPTSAAAYFQNTGVVSEAELPFTQTNESPFWPLSPGWQNRVYKIDSYSYFVGGPAAIKESLKQNGPIITEMQVDNDWYGPEHGNPRAAHAVLITGFHDDPGLPGGGYFIVKNSWGDWWGDQGYGKILYGTFGSYMQTVITGPAYATGPSRTLAFDTSASPGYQAQSSTWSANSSVWTTDGIGLNAWQNGEDAAVFASGGGSYTINVDNNISAHTLTFQNGAADYILSGGSLTITHGGITANENVLIQSEITVGAPQQWTVAGGKTLTVGSVNTHISPLTISGEGNTVIQGEIRDVHADSRFNGLLGGFAGSLLKTGNGTLYLLAANTYSGETRVSAGTLALSGPQGAILSSAVCINGGRLLLDNSVDNHAHRLSSAAGVALQGGELALQGNSVGTDENVDNLLLDSGASTLTVVAAENVSALIAPELARNPGATALVRGTNLGNGSSGAIGQIRFNSAPTLSNSGSGNQAGILPYLIGENNVAGSGVDLVTYGNAGLRPLTNSEYAAAPLTDRNVKLAASPPAVDSMNIRSLVLANNGAPVQATVNQGNVLTITSGAILSTGSVPNSLSGGSITFGDNSSTGFEGIVHAVEDLTIQSVIVDNGDNPLSLTKGGAGIFTLTGKNTYSGGTTVAAGILQIGDGGAAGSIIGDIINNAKLVFNRANKVTFSGAISGSGSLTKLGGNTLILTGDNTYQGGTNISEGTLQFGNGGVYGLARGPILNNGSLVFNVAGTVSFNDVISGSGSLTKLGSDELVLTNDNTYAGGTIISSGALRIGNGGASGSIVGDVLDNANLKFNRSDDFTFSGVISGSGNLMKLGKATLILTGANTYSGSTVIYDGILKLDPGASLASNLIDIRGGTFDVSDLSAYTLGAGKTIAGKGAVAGALTVLGTLAPGESPGILTVGNVTFGNGSELDIELGGAAPGLSYDVLNSTGDISLLAGSKLKLSLFSGFAPSMGNVFDIMNFKSLLGAFSILDLPQLDGSRYWDTNSLYLNGTISVVPEPAICALLLAALGSILFRQMICRRR